jgi:hypothetical protein
MKKRIILLISVTAISFFSCSNSELEDSTTLEETNQIDSNVVVNENTPLPRRSNLLNSSKKISDERVKLIAQVNNLKKDKAEYKSRKQNKKTKEKIDIISKKIRRKRIVIKSIEENDVKADDIPTHNRKKYTSLLFELAKNKSLRDEYSHRSDRRANSVRKRLDNESREIQKEINLLIN